MPTWLNAPHAQTALFGLGLGMAVLGLLSLMVTPFLLIRIPADYFTKPRANARRGSVLWFERIAKNVLGMFLLVLGIALLVLPGQGVLTLLVALAIMDYPGKRPFERWLLQLPRVLTSINALRARAGRPPLILDTPSEHRR